MSRLLFPDRDSWRRLRRLAREERAVVFVMFTLSLPVLLGMGALAVDVGYAYVARNIMQNGADAGARAGATVLANGGSTLGATASAFLPNNPDTRNAASAEGTSFANQNTSVAAYLSGATPVVTFPTPQSVRVTITHDLPLFFGPVIGFDTAFISVRATAGFQAVGSVNPGDLVPLAVYCNNPDGCNDVLEVGQPWSLRRYCGNFFMDGPNGSWCGNIIVDGEVFLSGITFNHNNSNSEFRQQVLYGYDGPVSLGQHARALPGNRNGWRDGMEQRLADGRNVVVFPVIRELDPADHHYNIEIVDFLQVRINGFQRLGNTDQTTFDIIRMAVSTTDFVEPGEGLGINSVVGVRMTE